MSSQAQIASNMLQAFAITEPDLDTSIGTTIRKMIDVEAQSIANADSNASLAITQYAIDSLSGSALDDFVSTFAFQRFAARRATGTVTFSVAALSTTAVVIPNGSNVSTNGSPVVNFSTLTAAVIASGASTVDIPVQAVVGGVAGNVSANTITQKVSPLTGVAAIANLVATSNGADAESDAALRDRFKSTIFRGYTGTEGQFLGCALENPNVSQANVVGSSKTHNEQIQIASSTGTSTVQDAQFIYDFNFTFGADIAANSILTPDLNYSFTVIPAIADPVVAPTALAGVGGTLIAGTYTYQLVYGGILGHLPSYTNPSPPVNVGLGATQNSVTLTWGQAPNLVPPNATVVYIFSGNGVLLASLDPTIGTWIDIGAGYPSIPIPLPVANITGYTVKIQSLDNTSCPDGIYDLQFEYLPAASRNDPPSGVTNKVDVYVVGTDEQSCVENIPFGTATFTGDPTSMLYYERFVRADNSHPTPGNVFLPLAFTPVTALPSTLFGNNVTFELGTDYFLVNDTTALGYTTHSLSGIEWVMGATTPGVGTLIDIDSYTYNAVPSEVEISIQKWRLVCYDVWVHQAQQAYIDIYLVVILAQGYTAATITPPLTTALAAVMSSVGFDGVLQTSSIISAAAQVSGITAVRFSTAADAALENTSSGFSNSDSEGVAAGPGYGIQQVVVTETNTFPPVVTTSLVKNWSINGRVVDAYFSDDTLPVLNDIFLDVRAQNSLNQGA